MVDRKYRSDPSEDMFYKYIDKPYETREDFFDEYTPGKRASQHIGNGKWILNGIRTRLLGFCYEVVLYWREDIDKFPFAYVFPKQPKDKGYYFYIRKDLYKEG